MADLMVALAIISVLVAMTSLAMRHHWHVRGLESAADELVSQLRELQSRSVAESHPLVYGARFSEGSSQWGMIRFDPKASGTGDDTCTQFSAQSFDDGLFSSPAIVQLVDAETTYETTFCRDRLVDADGLPVPAESDEFVFFYARGTATRAAISLSHSAIDDTRSIVVKGVTGRVDEL